RPLAVQRLSCRERQGLNRQKTAVEHQVLAPRAHRRSNRNGIPYDPPGSMNEADRFSATLPMPPEVPRCIEGRAGEMGGQGLTRTIPTFTGSRTTPRAASDMTCCPVPHFLKSYVPPCPKKSPVFGEHSYANNSENFSSSGRLHDRWQP